MHFQIQRWSWIFIFQSLLVQLSVAHLSPNILAREAIDNLFQRSLSKAEKARNAYTAVAITAAVVLVVGLVGLFLFIRKGRQVVAEPEAGADHKPSWWMVDGKTEKKDWWGLGLNAQASTPTESLGPDGRTRTQRLKAALRLRVPDQSILPTHRGTTTIPPLPMQTDQNRYPDSLERGGTQDPVPSLPQIPTMVIHSTHQHLEPNVSVPPRALLGHGSSSERRTLPRSPAAGRRRSRSLTQPIRNPFLPLGEPDGPVSQFPVLKARANESRNSHSLSIDVTLQPSIIGRTPQQTEPVTPRSGHPSALQLREPTTPRSGHRNRPPTLQLKEPGTPRSGRKMQFRIPGLPGSSRIAQFPTHV
jgi:hypothetical protein